MVCLLIDVIAQAKKQFPNIRCVLLGDGEQKQMIQKKINALNLNENIVLKGSIPHKDVLQYMANSKVFLHTSGYEGSSGVIMEALYSGCYVVSTISVSLGPVKHVQIANNVNGLAGKIADLLGQEELKHEKVIFNTMKSSTEELISIVGL
jgi:glycosyltransferase involved in cell wall biosynthesis